MNSPRISPKSLHPAAQASLLLTLTSSLTAHFVQHHIFPGGIDHASRLPSQAKLFGCGQNGLAPRGAINVGAGKDWHRGPTVNNS